MRILIAEDTPDARLVLRKTLEGAGHEVVEAVHGADALAKARQNPPQLIVSDILMPVMDGFKLCYEVKNDPALAQIPFVFYTATYVDPEDERLALNLGASRFILKPMEPDAFLAAVADVVRQAEEERLEVPEPALAEPENLFRQYRGALSRKLDHKVRQLEIYRGLFRNSDAAVAILAPQGEILHVNPAWEELLGCTGEGCLKLEPARFLDPEGAPALGAALADGRPFRGDAGVRTQGGRHLRVEVSAFPVRDESGEVSAQVLTLRDVTEQRRAEEELRWELRVGETLAELSRALIAENEPIEATSGRILRCAQAITGSAEGYAGEIDPETRAMVGHSLTAMLGEVCRVRAEQQRVAFPVRPDGTYPGLWGHALNTGEPFFANDRSRHPAALGLPPGHLPIERFLSVPVTLGQALVGQIALANPGRDYTDRDVRAVAQVGRLFALAIQRHRQREEHAALEEQLRQTQKMEAVGRLAGGVAHDFNNLLTVISGSAELAMLDLPGGSRAAVRVEQVVRASERAAELTRQLLAFSRKQVLQPREVDLNALVADLRRMFDRLLGEDVRVVLSLARDLDRVRVDPSQVEQVVMNLVVNARDAMPRGGTLTLETCPATLAEPLESQHGGTVPPGTYVRLAVTDTGVGMDRRTVTRIFEPFFTTKGEGHGTGLGLSTVLGIVEQSRGYLWVHSEPGRGSTFRIYLPPWAGEAEDTRAPEAAQAPRGSETVVVAEDDESVRTLVVAFLLDLGYRVLAASTGEEALATAERHGGPVHLLVADVVMPGLGGFDLGRRLAAARPGLRVLLVSGHAGEALARNGSLSDGVAFLAKPFTQAVLARKVREVLDAP